MVGRAAARVSTTACPRLAADEARALDPVVADEEEDGAEG